MKRSSLFAISLTVFTISVLLSCSNDNSETKIIKDKITGVSQKGPFIAGSKAILYELNDKLEQTGRSFEDVIADNYGNFEIKSVELNSPYAMLNASGKYRNEVTGEVSVGDINLYAIVDLTDRDKVNINVLTHLEYYRVQKLVENGMSVRDAKKQAQREILAVFGISGDFENSEDMDIFGTTEGDAALLAISVLLQGHLSEDKIIERLNDFRQSFKESGTWENNTTKEAIADWASVADLAAIKNNVLNWGLSNEVPEFGSYIHNYWLTAYELGECTDSRKNEVKHDYVCKYGSWRIASYKDIICSEKNNCNYLTDSRDGQIYAYVTIGEQTWMAENLNYSRDGTIGNCSFDNPDNCAKYGRLYDWETAMNVCPTGWHLPTKTEWDALIDFDGDDFAALPGGRGDFSSYSESFGNQYMFISPSEAGYWWSATEYNDDIAHHQVMYYDYSLYDGYKKNLQSVRCIMD